MADDDWNVQAAVKIPKPDAGWEVAKAAPKKPGLLSRIGSDIADIYRQGREAIPEGARAIREGVKALTPEQQKRFDEIQRTMPPGYEKYKALSEIDQGSTLKAVKGVGEIAGGVWDVVTSIPMGALRTIVSRPIEEKTGLPKEVTEFGLGLALPGVGILKYGKIAGKVSEAISSNPVGRTINEIFSPQTVSKEGELAGALIRAESGTAARDTLAAEAQLEPFRKQVNQMSPEKQLDLVAHMEGKTKGAIPDEFKPVADKLREVYADRAAKIQATKSLQDTNLLEDYYHHLWADPAAARAFTKSYFSKQGSGGALKQRKYPTVADGMAAGLTPKFDPITTTLLYANNMDKYIAANRVMDEARALKQVKFFTPGSRNVPEGWVELGGRLSMKHKGQTPIIMKAYAPADFARVYNNFISKGFYGNESAGKVFDALQKGSNSITALELGLSGYHAFTMANEAGISELSRGIGKLFGGSPVGAFKSVLKAPTKPFEPMLPTRFSTGKKMRDVYLGHSPGTPDMRRIVDLLERAGGRAAGYKHAPEYQFTAMDDYWTSFKRGALKLEASQALQTIKAQPIVGTAKVALNQMGRVLSSVAYPIFKKYIPLLKNSAFHDTMQAWLEVNPAANYDQQLAVARKIWDSIDNRFGEVVQDNIFWNKIMKQTAQLAMRSYSWNLGTVRELGGGAKDILRRPSSLSMKSEQWSPRANYVVALPIWVATANAVYQYLKTGKPHESIEDLMAGRTGGTAPGVGGRGTVEERAMMPGYQKDVFGWYFDAKQEAKNKLATGPRMVGEILSNKDWRDDPIINPQASVPEWFTQYWDYLTKTVGPISIRQLEKGEKKGSAISTPEMLSGIRPAPAPLQDPKGYKSTMDYIERKKWLDKQKHDERLKKQYGNYE